MTDAFQRFRESVQGKDVEKATEIERVECSVCSQYHEKGVACPGCGYDENQEETTPLQEFVKSLRGRKI